MIKSTYLIVEASLLFFFFSFFMGVIMQDSGYVPNRPESECAFSSAFGSDIHRRERSVTALTSISPASE